MGEGEGKGELDFDGNKMSFGDLSLGKS